LSKNNGNPYQGGNMKVYRVKEVAEILQLGTTKTYELIREGKIKAKKIGSAYRITEKSLEEYLEN
jgi:excisionase family DNA binding protein